LFFIIVLWPASISPLRLNLTPAERADLVQYLKSL
jgi:hypothetical protein